MPTFIAPRPDHRSVAAAPGLARQLALTLLASLAIALGAQVAVPLLPVPVTMQTFAVAIIAALLGPRIALGAVALYLLEGAIGLPVFAHATGGAARLVGPTGGYLFAFLAAAIIIGSAAARADARRSFPRLLTAMLLADAVILFFGALWLALFLTAASSTSIPAASSASFAAASDASANSFTAAFLGGILPFLPGAILKSSLAALLISRLSRSR